MYPIVSKIQSRRERNSKIQKNRCLGIPARAKMKKKDVIAGSNREVDRILTDWRVRKFGSNVIDSSNRKLIGDELTDAWTK